MGFLKIIEASCDNCGQGLSHYSTINSCKEDIAARGGIVKGKKFFCDKECYMEYMKLKQQSKYQKDNR